MRTADMLRSITTTDSARYRTVTRSARNFDEFSTAKKRVSDRNLSRDEARRACDEFNSNRTAAQIRRGTKMEFEAQ
jgi:hypothetical protein